MPIHNKVLDSACSSLNTTLSLRSRTILWVHIYIVPQPKVLVLLLYAGPFRYHIREEKAPINCFCTAKDQTQCLPHASQVFYHVSYTVPLRNRMGTHMQTLVWMLRAPLGSLRASVAWKPVIGERKAEAPVWNEIQQPWALRTSGRFRKGLKMGQCSHKRQLEEESCLVSATASMNHITVPQNIMGLPGGSR